MKINNKIVFTFLLIFVVLFSFSCNCFAKTYDYNGNKVELPDLNFSHYVILEKGGNYYALVLDEVYNKNAYVTRNKEGGFCYSTDKNSIEKERNPRYYQTPLL